MQEQLEIARADASGKVYTASKRKWVLNEDGTKAAVEVSKRLKPWYRLQPNGTVLLTVRYGSKPIEFEKGKAAILLKSRDELLVVIPKLIAAVDAGELDGHMVVATKRRPVPKRSAA